MQRRDSLLQTPLGPHHPSSQRSLRLPSRLQLLGALGTHLQTDAAGNGQGVAMLVVELNVADQCLVHACGMAGRQGVQLGLQRECWSP